MDIAAASGLFSEISVAMKTFQIQRHADLPFNEQYVLWGLRLWSLGNDTGSNIASKIHEGFLRGGLPHAAQSLTRIMNIIASSGYRPPQIHCGCVGTVSDDENLILNSIAQCQIGNPEVLRFWFDDLVPPAIVSLLLSLLEEFANDLMEGGIFMSRERGYVGADLMVFASSQHKTTGI